MSTGCPTTSREASLTKFIEENTRTGYQPDYGR
jgi:hypothetical protein